MPPKRRAGELAVGSKKRTRTSSNEPEQIGEISSPIRPRREFTGGLSGALSDLRRSSRQGQVATTSTPQDQHKRAATSNTAPGKNQHLTKGSRLSAGDRRGSVDYMPDDSKSSGHDTIPHKGMAEPSKRPRGRPRKYPRPTAPVVVIDDDSGTDVGKDDTANAGEADQQYWLLKAEPNDRFENGHNVKFSIDDLAAATRPEPWDGVRNYVARNNMRAMRKGDLGFFYHSNCKVPGIVGILRIVREHTVDKSAFDPKHPYYDPKSQREKPRWDVVHVAFVKKFDEQITLKDVQNTKELADMALLKYKRLSVTSVRPDEWKHILKMAGEHPDVGVDNNELPNGGYESDTEGEASKTAVNYKAEA